MLNLQCGTKSRNNQHIVLGNSIPGNELPSISVHDELNTATFQIVVYLLIMDHLTQQVNFLVGVFFQRFVADFNGIFYAIAKPKMTSDIKTNRTEIQKSRRKILLTQIF